MNSKQIKKKIDGNKKIALSLMKLIWKNGLITASPTFDDNLSLNYIDYRVPG